MNLNRMTRFRKPVHNETHLSRRLPPFMKIMNEATERERNADVKSPLPPTATAFL